MLSLLSPRMERRTNLSIARSCAHGTHPAGNAQDSDSWSLTSTDARNVIPAKAGIQDSEPRRSQSCTEGIDQAWLQREPVGCALHTFFLCQTKCEAASQESRGRCGVPKLNSGVAHVMSQSRHAASLDHHQLSPFNNSLYCVATSTNRSYDPRNKPA